MATDLFEEEEENLIIDVPSEKRYLNTTSYDYSVEFLVNLMQDGKDSKIVLEVPFQRQYVWKDDKASQLIESIIMNVPIPPIYFAEEEDGKWLVIDGLQRLNSLKRYFENEFGLKQLDILKDLEKEKYKDLRPKAKSLLENGQLRVNVLRKDTHPDIKYDVFMRLNKGAVTLNYQELRNCLYRGDLNDVAKRLTSNNKSFLKILNLEKPHNRFLDVELVLRLLALSKNLVEDENGNYVINEYKGRMVTYLNNFMEQHRELDKEEVKQLSATFDTTIAKIVAVFGTDKAFRDITASKNIVNKSLADCIFISFGMYELEDLENKKREIIEALRNLLATDKDFKNSISLKTSDASILFYRIDKWIKVLKDVI